MNLEKIISKFKVKSHIVCDYQDIEKLIEEYYGFDEYQIACQEEQGNDTSLVYMLDGDLDEPDDKDIAEMVSSKKPKQYQTATLLNNLCKEGILVPGEYLINISW